MEVALERLAQHPADVVLVALDFPPEGGSSLLHAIRRRPEWEKIPVVALVDSPNQAQDAAALAAGFDDCQPKFDRALLLGAVARLVSSSSSLTPVSVGAAQ